MSGGGTREVVVLGTSAQVPTRARNQNGYLLRWDGEAILFDPGEGTQRQLLAAGVSTGGISAVAITHLHGDHCLGLPGVLGRFVLDQRRDPLDLYFPASGLPYIERLCTAAVFDPFPHLRLHPLPATTTTIDRGRYRIVARPLDHSIDTLGWRIEEAEARHLLSDRLEEAGIRGPDVGRLVADGAIEVAGRTVHLDDVTTTRPGQRFAFVMDTATCDNAVALADGADLLLCESTFLESDGSFARDYRHLTGRQAGWIAAEAGARHLLLSHFSARHPDANRYVDEAAELVDRVTAAQDLEVVSLPPRRTPSEAEGAPPPTGRLGPDGP